MSLASKITLGVACAASASIIGYVHYKQNSDREKLHEGVVRDIERQQRRKLENTYELQKQIDLTKQLRDIQATQESAQNSSHTDTGKNTDTQSPDIEKVRSAPEVGENNIENNAS